MDSHYKGTRKSYLLNLFVWFYVRRNRIFHASLFSLELETGKSGNRPTSSTVAHIGHWTYIPIITHNPTQMSSSNDNDQEHIHNEKTILRILCLHDCDSNALELHQSLKVLDECLYDKHGMELVYINSPLIPKNDDQKSLDRILVHGGNCLPKINILVWMHRCCTFIRHGIPCLLWVALP